MAMSDAATTEQAPRAKTETVQVVLGLDFGTCYTKLCYRIRGRGFNEVKVAPIIGPDGSWGILPSIVHEGQGGELWTIDGDSGDGNPRIHRYLKMKLAGMWGYSTKAGGEANEALAAFYMADVIRRFRHEVEKAEKTRLDGRRVLWAAKACVPIGNKDSGLMKAFSAFYAKAWELSLESLPTTKRSLLDRYRTLRSDSASSPCQGYPEIGAAVYSFLLTRDAVPGLYCYLDIGGGTLDCSAFHLKKDHDGASHIYVYSTSVSELGLESICRRMGIKDEDLLHHESRKLFESDELQTSGILGEMLEEIRRAVAGTLVEMRQKAKVENVWQLNDESYTLHVGGGGAKSPWYTNAITSTMDRWSPGDSLRRGFAPCEVPIAPGLSLPVEMENQRYRFAVSYGLTVPFGEEPPIQGFPWEFFAYSPVGSTSLMEMTHESGHPCRCNGYNPDCTFCGGSGYIEENSPAVSVAPVASVARRRPEGLPPTYECHASQDTKEIGEKDSSASMRKSGIPLDMHKSCVDFAIRVLRGRLKNDWTCHICYRPIREKTMSDHIDKYHPQILKEARSLLGGKTVESKQTRQAADDEHYRSHVKTAFAPADQSQRIAINAKTQGTRPPNHNEGYRLNEQQRFNEAVKFSYSNPVVTWRGEECNCFICNRLIPKNLFFEHMRDHYHRHG